MSGARSRAASKTLSRRIELKAFLKSSLSSVCSSVRFCRNFRVAWTAASAPLHTPYPNCLGLSSPAISSTTHCPAILATSLRSVQPTAMGRTPPDFFSSATNVAPKKNGRIAGGTLPSITRAQNGARDCRSLESSSSPDVRKRSLRC